MASETFIPQDQIGLLSIPPEVRLGIWKQVLQLTPAEAAEHSFAQYINSDLFLQLAEGCETASYLPSTCSAMKRQPPNLLRVCKAIHAEATPLLHDNIIVVETPTGDARQPNFLATYAKVVARLRRPRPLPIRRALLIVHAGNYYRPHLEVVAEDAPLVADLCDALSVAAQDGPLEWLHVHVVDWTINEVFGRNERLVGVTLLRGAWAAAVCACDH
ncbi:hypothetical protein MVEN_02033500 [Mycena venus]|uniref:Uncharacterized protein n=1 Tax=Mycena venus TaxID=2733690 RepID=A0A8H6XCR8_9AGAR|nr:hypothetical protein MVEN_02033500 [Mycena venus]